MILRERLSGSATLAAFAAALTTAASELSRNVWVHAFHEPDPKGLIDLGILHEDDPIERRSLGETVLRQVEFINAMTRETVAFARGDRQLWVRKVYLRNFFQDLAEQLRPELEEQNVRLDLDLRARLLLLIKRLAMRATCKGHASCSTAPRASMASCRPPTGSRCRSPTRSTGAGCTTCGPRAMPSSSASRR